MNKDKSTLRSFYTGGISAITIFALLISTALSIVFWLSFSTTPFLSLLFILFALVFESTKNYALIESFLEKNWGKKTIKLSFYVLLTIISVIGSAGGLNSLLKQHEYHATNQSLVYQQYNQQITQTEQLIDTDRMLAQSDLAHNYRSNADRLLTIEIPKLEKNITALQQHKKKLSETVTNPTTLAINILPTKHAEIILLITLALLIDLISAFLIGLCFSKLNTVTKVKVANKVTAPTSSIDANKKAANQHCLTMNASKHVQSAVITNKLEPTDSVIDDLIIRVKKNLKNNIYEPKITKIMHNEKIGYQKAKLILQACTVT